MNYVPTKDDVATAIITGKTSPWDIRPIYTLPVKIVCNDPKYMPEYANPTDACMDLKIRLPKGIDSITLPARSTSDVYGTGIKVAIPEECVMLIFPRSSTGFKYQCILANTTGVIDAGFRDEIKLKFINLSDNDVEFSDGQRVAQFMIIPRPTIKFDVVEDDVNFRTGDRGGGIGSTGK